MLAREQRRTSSRSTTSCTRSSLWERRPLRTCPFYERGSATRRVFLEAAGWERPHWYEANAGCRGPRHPPPDDGRRATGPRSRRRGAGHPRTGGDVRHDVAEAAGDLPEGARQRSCNGDHGGVDKSIGTVTYCLLLDEDGGVRSDVTVARLGPGEFQVGANGPLDLDCCGGRLPADGVGRSATPPLAPAASGYGDRSRARCSSRSPADLASVQLLPRHAASTSARAGPARSYPTWANWAGSSTRPPTWAASSGTRWEAGQRARDHRRGRGASNSLRLEKGYRSFGTDMTFEHDPGEAGLGLRGPGRQGLPSPARAAAPRPRDDVTQGADLPHPRRDGRLGKEPVFADGLRSATSPAPPTATPIGADRLRLAARRARHPR